MASYNIFFHVSPPYSHKYCSLRVSIEAELAVIESVIIVIAQLNSQMPYTFRDVILHISNIDFMNFIRGASLDEEGIAIIVLPIITKNSDSSIVPFFKQGAGAVTLCSHIK